MTAVEFGVEYHGAHDVTFVAGGYTEAGARRMVDGGTALHPKAVRVMRRECSEWVAVDAVEVAS